MSKPVGRPPEVDKNGKVISKTLVNLTIPVKLKEFLDKHVKNRSEFFTKIVTMLYIGEICPKCYSDDYISKHPVGIECTKCDIYIQLNDCSNCGTRMDPRKTMMQGYTDVPNPHYNPAHGSKQCSKCKLKEDLEDSRKTLREMGVPEEVIE